MATSAHAEFGRSTSFDDREECRKVKGVWHEFGNSSGDSCEAKLDAYLVAAQVITYACDCGKGRCWNGDTCVLMSDYKKIYDQKKEREGKKIAEERKARSDEYRDYSNDRLSKIISEKSAAGSDQESNNFSQFRDKLSNAVTSASSADVVNGLDTRVQNIANDAKRAEQAAGIGKFLSLPQQNNQAENQAAAQPVITTAPAPAASDPFPAGPTPFFLQQQENATKEAAAKASAALAATPAAPSASKPSKADALPELPQIPLPQ